MELKLKDNIRACRRQLGLTQEQLAEAMGVTVGAVSKWESGQSNPDLTLIPELADFFETSVDVLLGYDRKSHGMQSAAENIRRLAQAKKFPQAVKEAQKALQKYPNSFEVVHESASLYYNYAVESGLQPIIQTAHRLLERTCELIGQCKDSSVTVPALESDIATLYSLQGQQEKAIDLLKKNNVSGVNNIQIGMYLADIKRYEESLSFLSYGYVDSLFNLFIGSSILAQSLFNLKRKSEALALTERLIVCAKGYLQKEKVSYCDKIYAILCTVAAVLHFFGGKEQEAADYLREARDSARRFDTAPDFSCASIPFYCAEDRSVYDNAGESALQSVEKQMAGCENECEKTAILNLWKTVCEEKV